MEGVQQPIMKGQINSSAVLIFYILRQSGIWAELQDVRMAHLLPPVGSEVFRRFTPASLEEVERRHEVEEKQQRRRKNIEV